MQLFAALLMAALSVDPFVGINEDLVWTSDAELSRTVEALQTSGAQAIRIPFRWRVAEPERGMWVFDKMDRVVAALPKDMEILATLMSPPAWATGVDPAKCEGWFDAYPPKDLALWSAYVMKVVSRYKNRVKHWEVWNEENGVDFYRPLPDAMGYTALLRSAYKAAKKADPRCVVVLGGLQMNGVMANPWSPVKTPDFLEALYGAGARKWFDVCNIHPYVLPSEGTEHMMEMIRDTFAVMERHGDRSKPLWITEVGCGLNSEITNEMQTKLLSDTYRVARTEPRIKRVYWFMLRDMENNLLGPEASMGIVKRDFTTKPVFEAFRGVVTDSSAKNGNK